MIIPKMYITCELLQTLSTSTKHSSSEYQKTLHSYGTVLFSWSPFPLYVYVQRQSGAVCSPSCVCRTVLLANWERVLCYSSAPEVSVSTHTHCSRTNENTLRHLPRRDTPSPSPCPSTLLPLFSSSSHFYSLMLPLLSFVTLPHPLLCPHSRFSLPIYKSFDPPLLVAPLSLVVSPAFLHHE